MNNLVKRVNSWSLPTKLGLGLSILGLIWGGSHVFQFHFGSGDNVAGDKITKTENVNSILYFSEVGTSSVSSGLNQMKYSFFLEPTGEVSPPYLCVKFEVSGNTVLGGAIILHPDTPGSSESVFQSIQGSNPHVACVQNPVVGRWVSIINATTDNKNFIYDYYPKSKNQQKPDWVVGILGN